MASATAKLLKRIPSSLAAKAPVHTPEPGKGMPINKPMPIVPYFSTYGLAFLWVLATILSYITLINCSLVKNLTSQSKTANKSKPKRKFTITATRKASCHGIPKIKIPYGMLALSSKKGSTVSKTK